MKRLILLFLFMLLVLPGFTQSITKMEYFIDTDPGYGNGTYLSFTPGYNVSCSFLLNSPAVTQGMHVLYIRAKDNTGQWSVTGITPFFKETLSNTIKIDHMEYFVDTDPGNGNGTDIPITTGTEVSVVFTINQSGLTDGMHILYVRTRDQEQRWSTRSITPFYVENLLGISNIDKLEYFIDTDPGFGSGTSVTIIPGINVSKVFTINTTGLSEGMHLLYLRARDAQKRWSIRSVTPMIIENLVSLNPVNFMEYFLDTDPGYGNGHAIPITPGTKISSVFNVDITGQTPGVHVLYLRVKNAGDCWSTAQIIPFSVEYDSGNVPITQLEYFFDADPNYGNATPVSIPPSTSVEQTFTMDTTGLSNGFHYLFVRVGNSKKTWSQTNNSGFAVVNLKAYLEGLYDPSANQMNKVWDENGEHFPGDIVDTLTLQLANAAPPYALAASYHGLPLHQNGVCRHLTSGIQPQSYYLIVQPKNAIETWSANPVDFTSPGITYDFTANPAMTYGNNVKNIGGVYALYTGDINTAGNLYPASPWKDGVIDLEDIYYVFDSYNAGDYGYYTQDLNGDSVVDISDTYLAYDNYLLGINLYRP